MVKQLKMQAVLSLLLALLLLISLSAATLAWFTNSSDTNVLPMEGKIGSSGGSLLISSSPDGEFSLSCDLIVPNDMTVLAPISTANLTNFFIAGDQSPDDRIVSFLPGNDLVDRRTLHGHVFLKAVFGDADVYFDPENLDFGSDIQALAAMRLGLRIRLEDGTATDYLLKLDKVKDTNAASVKETIAPEYYGMVVASVSGKNFTMVKDPSVSITDYYAVMEEETLAAGEKCLCTVAGDTVADVEYWLYLEGCDNNCFNDVQLRNVALQLAFFGDMVEEEPED